MNGKSVGGIALSLFSSISHAQVTYQLGDATNSGIGNYSSDVAWSSLGGINWRKFDPNDANGEIWCNGNNSWPSPWFPGNTLISNFFDNSSSTNNNPKMAPYGDILSYTGSGVGDVNGDGEGDFALTWYTADKDRGDPCGGHPHPWGSQPSQTGVVDFCSSNTMERVGFVRVMSGKFDSDSNSGSCVETNPLFAEPGGALVEPEFTTLSTSFLSNDNLLRRLGDPIDLHSDAHGDFWGEYQGDLINKALWSHEITTVGNIDDFSGDEMLLCANIAELPSGNGDAGLVEIWSFTDRYYTGTDGPPARRWVKLIEIVGLNDPNVKEEFGYTTFEGPPPLKGLGYDVNYSRDFNNDGQPDLMIGSKWYRDISAGDPSDRNQAPGAVWIFFLPKADVFDHIDEISEGLCDNEFNRSGNPIGMDETPDKIVDLLPLRYTSDEYNVKIVGHQTVSDHPDAEGWYPKHFGFEIAPAGDLNGDGTLDLAVAAPFHFSNSQYVAYEAANGVWPITTPGQPGYTGNVYLFLNESCAGSSGGWGCNQTPKFVHTSKPRINLQCGQGSYFAYYNRTIDVIPNQVDLTSAQADFVIEGTQPATPSQNGTAGFGSNLTGGIQLDGDSGGEPDLAIADRFRERVYVFRNLTSAVGMTDWNTVMGSTTIWNADSASSTWVNGPFNTTDENFFGIYSNYDATSFGTEFVGIQSMDQEFGRIAGVRLAGDQDGDGDCELFIAAHNVLSPRLKMATISLDINDGSSGSSATLLGTYLPEQFAWEDSSQVGNSHSQTNEHNSDQKLARTGNMTGWPVWNPGAADDAIFGVRHYPRRVNFYPSNDMNSWIPTPPRPAGMSELDYDKLTLVPAGKAYLVRTITSP